jgi:signal transduction histidine kinase
MPYTWPRTRGETVCAIHVRSTFAFKPIFNSLAKMRVSPEDELFDLLREAETASTRAQTLTKQLLTFAKGGSPIKEIASIKDMLKESSAFVLRGSKSGCEISIQKDLWPAEVDVGQISQVINNPKAIANQQFKGNRQS